MAVVAAIVVSENAPHEPVGSTAIRLTLAAGCTMAVVAVAMVGSFAIARAMHWDAHGRMAWLRRFGRLKQVHTGLWLAVIGFIIYVLNWPQIVRFNWGLDHAIVVKDLLVLAPIWVPLVLSWAAFYEVEDAAFRTSQSRRRTGNMPSSGPLSPSAPATCARLFCRGTLTCQNQNCAQRTGDRARFTRRGAFVWLHARHYLGVCFLPILALLAFQDAVTFVAPDWQEKSAGWLVYLAPVAVVTIAFPYLLAHIWRTSSVEECSLRTRLVRLTRRMGVRCRDFRIWRTENQMLNAAVAGLVPSLRYIFITDALIAKLRDDELESVVAHELGHVRRHHLLLRMLMLGLPLWVMANIQALAPHVSDQFREWFAACGGTIDTASGLALPAAMLLYAVTTLGWYSRLLEHDADLCVVDIGHGATLAATIDRLSYLGDNRRYRKTWLHPSPVARIHLLRLAHRDPAIAGRFRHRVDGHNRLLILAWILAPVVALVL